jgi:ribosome-binding protein aMBF1 (putative translation factor)
MPNDIGESGFRILVGMVRDIWVARTTYMPETAVLKELLRDIRERAGLRQVDLAEAIGRSQSFVSEYEAGQRRLDLVELRAVSVACGTTLRKLVDEYERRLMRVSGGGRTRPPK